VSLPALQFARPIERRSGIERRRQRLSEAVNVFRTDDRRLGLGRRWEDWCRTVEAHRGSGRDLDPLP
jgi:hypothetical protein